MQKPPPVGIDLGTTFSVIAYLDANGRPWTILNSEGDPTTPTVVLFDEHSVVVGKEAVKASGLEPARVADFAKRDMGSQFYSRLVKGEQFPPEVIQSFVLKKLKQDAERKIGPFTQAVVTVPAYFTEPRRKATQDAGKLAGLEVIDIINEPTAAAIAFGFQQGFLTPAGEAKQAEKVVVYDLGGGTFDVTVMDIAGKNFSAVATGGDVFLGGYDWDRRIADIVAEHFLAKHPGPDPRQSPAGLNRLLREAEDAKRALTAREQATVVFELDGKSIRVPIARKQFEERTADLLERTRFTVRKVLGEAKLTWEQVTRVLLVGGSTRMPMVQRMLEQEAGRKLDHSLSVDEAVAHGAALYAGLVLSSKAGAAPDMAIRNVNSHNLGVLGVDTKTGRPRSSVLIPRNTALPATAGKRYKTAKPNQRNVEVKVIEGGDSSGNNSTPIGTCVIRDLPSGLPAGTPVEVAFTYAANGRLTVRARLPDLNRAASLTIERATGLTDAKLGEWAERIEDLDAAAIVPADEDPDAIMAALDAEIETVLLEKAKPAPPEKATAIGPKPPPPPAARPAPPPAPAKEAKPPAKGKPRP